MTIGGDGPPDSDKAQQTNKVTVRKLEFLAGGCKWFLRLRRPVGWGGGGVGVVGAAESRRGLIYRVRVDIGSGHP